MNGDATGDGLTVGDGEDETAGEGVPTGDGEDEGTGEGVPTGDEVGADVGDALAPGDGEALVESSVREKDPVYVKARVPPALGLAAVATSYVQLVPL